MNDFSAFAFSAGEGFDETATRAAFSRAVPLRTIVIYCYDPRATQIPELVADLLGDIYPGSVLYETLGRSLRAGEGNVARPIA